MSHQQLMYLYTEFQRLTCEENYTQGEALDVMREEMGSYTLSDILSAGRQEEEPDDYEYWQS